MSLFLHRKNNLADVENVVEARENLGFGTMAYFDSNDVNIEGGKIEIDSLVINSKNASLNRFLVCSDIDGSVDFVDVEFGDWITNDPNEIKLSQFDVSDVLLLNSNTLCNIAFTGNYNDLTTKFTKWSDLVNDLDYLYTDLRNLSDINSARSNLQLGSLSFNDYDDHIFFKNLTIHNQLKFENYTVTDNPQYLYLDNEGFAHWTSLLKASSSNYGVVKLTDEYLYQYTDSNHVSPSMIAIQDLYNYFSQLLNDIGNISGDLNIQQVIADNGLFKKINNLSEIVNKEEAQKNLGFDVHMRNLIKNINTNNEFEIKTLRISSNLIYKNDNNFNLGEARIGANTFLAIDSLGKTTPKELPFATNTEAGFVYITNDYTQSFTSEYTVLSVQGLNNFLNNIYIPYYTTLSNNIDPLIRSIYNEYMKVQDNIRVDNPSIARQHLQLHDFAHTGDYFQLSNKPTNLSQFSNDITRFISAHSNLSDLDNIQEARKNLGIGNISYYDSNNVLILGGNATFSNLVVSKHMQYKYDNTNTQNMFLQSINTQGDCRWKPLPIASSTHKGIVKLESDYTKYSDTYASSAAALFKVYYKLLGEIDSLQREVNRLDNLVK